MNHTIQTIKKLKRGQYLMKYKNPKLLHMIREVIKLKYDEYLIIGAYNIMEFVRKRGIIKTYLNINEIYKLYQLIYNWELELTELVKICPTLSNKELVDIMISEDWEYIYKLIGDTMLANNDKVALLGIIGNLSLVKEV